MYLNLFKQAQNFSSQFGYPKLFSEAALGIYLRAIDLLLLY